MEEQRIGVHDGMLMANESWVYAWVDLDGRVIYVGATGLPVAARTWVHLTSEDPHIGRVLAHHQEALVGRVDVRAWRLPPAADRTLVRDAVSAAVIAGSDPPGPLDPASAAAADEILDRLQS